MAYVKKFTRTLFGQACALHSFSFAVPPVPMWAVDVFYTQKHSRKQDQIHQMHSYDMRQFGGP